jgi:hypothetical protein
MVETTPTEHQQYDDMSWDLDWQILAFQTANYTPIYTPEQIRMLERTEITFSSISITFSGLYVLYIVSISLYTFPWKHLFRCLCSSYMSWRQLLLSIQNECFIVSRPIARLFFFLQLYECIFTSFILIRKRGKAACFAQYFIIQFFGLAKFVWALVVAVWMFWILALGKRNKLLLLEVLSHLSVLITAVPLTILPYATGSVSAVGVNYCWIRGDTLLHKLMRLTLYIPLWLSMTLIILIYCATGIVLSITQIRSFRNSSRTRQFAQLASSLKLYIKLFGLPIIFFLSRLASTIRYIWRDVTGQVPFALDEIFAFTAPATGLSYTLLILLSEAIGRFCDFIRKETIEQETTNTELNEATDYVRWEEEEEIDQVGKEEAYRHF